MFKLKTVAFVVAAAIGSAAVAPAAFAACTTEDLSAKATELSTALQKLAASDQNRALAVTQRMQEVQTKQANPGSMAEACKLYDDLLAEARK